MPKERIFVPGPVIKKFVKTQDGHDVPVYEQGQHLGMVVMDIWPTEWVNIRMHAGGIHVCAQNDPPADDANWESVVFG